MVREARHLETSDGVLEMPAHLTERQRLEFEVSQSADGSLAPERRAEVEAAMARDAGLRGLHAEMVGVDALLSRRPDVGQFDFAAMSDRVMAVIEADQEEGSASLTPMLTMRGWWLTVSAAAAALLLGLTAGVLMMRSESVQPTLLVQRGSSGPQVSGQGSIEVAGPIALLAQQQADLSGAVAMSVTGPDVHAILDPMTADTDLSNQAALLGGTGIVETPSRSLIAVIATE